MGAGGGAWGEEHAEGGGMRALGEEAEEPLRRHHEHQRHPQPGRTATGQMVMGPAYGGQKGC